MTEVVTVIGTPAARPYVQGVNNDQEQKACVYSSQGAAGTSAAHWCPPSSRPDMEEAQRMFGPLADALALDQQFTSQHARDELGWSPTGPSPLEYLRGLRDEPMVDGSIAV